VGSSCQFGLEKMLSTKARATAAAQAANTAEKEFEIERDALSLERTRVENLEGEDKQLAEEALECHQMQVDALQLTLLVGTRWRLRHQFWMRTLYTRFSAELSRAALGATMCAC
jgi:hypothetical protein